MITGRRPIRSESQPATSGIGTERTISDAVHQVRRRLGQADHERQVGQREQVHDAQAATAAAEDRGEVDPAVVVVGEDRPERVPDAAVGDGRLAVDAALADEQQDRDRDDRPPGSRTGRRPSASRTRVIIAAPTIATTTVPTFPPLMWALIANPRRSSGNCSARSPLPTGCCGAPPIRDATLTAANVANAGASACAAKPPPNRIPPPARIVRRETTRVSFAKLSWISPLAIAPTRDEQRDVGERSRRTRR